MAILSNINGKFAVDSSGGIQFSGQTGTSGYVLKSNGNAAPTWVDGSTVIGGPYLPLSGGTLTGATATASGISFTVGGALTGTTAGFSGSISASGNSNSFGNTTIAALSASTGTFSASVTAAGNSNSFGTTTFAGNVTFNGPSTKFNTDGDSFFEILDAGTNACYLRAGASDEIYIGANNNYQLRLKTNKDVVMDNGGNLGIGTASPKTSLDVYKDADIWHLMVGGGTKKLLIGGQGANGITIQGGAASTPNNAAVTTPYNISLQRDGGNVGIGNTTPASKLHTGDIVAGSFLPYLNGTALSFATSTNIITVHDSSALGTNTAAGLMLVNNNNSNNAPSPLIAFSARSTSNTYNHTYAAIWGEKDSTGADANWNTGGLVFATSTSTGPYERMRISPLGAVSIGTTNNSAKLNVGGSILASDDNQSSGMYVRRTLNLVHPGSTGTFTRTFNPVTQFGISRLGGNVLLEVSGWSQRVNCGYIQWQNAGGSGNITTVNYVQTASLGSGGDISVSVNSANDNSIDINFSNWHTNSHAWLAKIVTQ